MSAPDKNRPDAHLTEGQRVTITSATHPWRGFSGVLAPYPYSEDRLDWIVELDNGMRAAVTNAEVRRV